MKTSYFAKYRGTNGVCIAMRPPKGFTGRLYPALFPKWHFLKKYKQDGDEEAYTEAYHKEVLQHIDPRKVFEDLKDATLLCYERAGSFCHRRIVAEWLVDNLCVDYPGISIKEDPS